MITSKSINKLLEGNWSDNIKISYHLPEGLFTKPAAVIAKTLKDDSKDLQQSRLNFYVNRARSNLSKSTKLELEKAKDTLKLLY